MAFGCAGNDVVLGAGFDLPCNGVAAARGCGVVFACTGGGVPLICGIGLAGLGVGVARCVCICHRFGPGIGAPAGVGVGVGVGDADRDLLYFVWPNATGVTNDIATAAMLIRATIRGLFISEIGKTIVGQLGD
jgi:hypothetical protein